MRSLMVLVHPEGNSDPALLCGITHRLVLELCQRGSRGEVIVGDPADARNLHGAGGRIGERCANAVRSCGTSDVILFVHADGAGDAEHAYGHQVAVAVREVQAIGRSGQRAVGLVPVREMEAWALADEDALAHSLGMGANRRILREAIGSGAVDQITNPNAALNAIAIEVLGLRGYRRRGVDSLLRQIGDSAKLERLRLLTAFQRLERDTQAALIGMYIIEGGSQ